MKLLMLAATVAMAIAAPQITSSGDDISITGKTIQFMEMAGSSTAVNRAFTVTKNDIQFSSDSSDTFSMLMTMVTNEQNRQAQLLQALNTMKGQYDALVTKYNNVKAKQANIDTTIGAKISTARTNLQKLKDANTNDLQPALAKVKTDVSSTSSLDTSKASAISTALDAVSANGLFDTVEARAQTAFDTAKATATSVSSAAATNTAAIDPRVAVISANVTRMSVNFTTYGPAAIDSIQTSTMAAQELAAGYVAFVNGELAYADSTLPALTAANSAFKTKNATISALVVANTATYKKQLDVFRPIIKAIYGGAKVQKVAPSSLAVYDYFGQTLAASGSTMVSGMTGYGRSGAVAVLNFDSTTGFGKDWDELIPYPGTDLYSNFGYDVALEGGILVAGAPYYDQVTPRVYTVGVVYVFKRGSDGKFGTNTPQKLLHSTKPGANDRFGNAVAITNGVIYAAAPYHENTTLSKAVNHGTIFVFVANSAGVYSKVAELIDTTASSNDYVGLTNAGLAALGNTVAVNAYYGEGTGVGTNHGEIIIYNKGTGNKFTQMQKFTGKGTAAYDYFGGSLHLAQTKDKTMVLAAGAYGDDGNSSRFISSSGAVYIFEKKSGATNFTQTQILRASDAMSADYFGREAVFSPDGMTLVISADGVDDRSKLPIKYGIGAAYIFTRNTAGQYVQVNRKLPVTDTTYSYFGRGICFGDEFYAIGSYRDSTAANYAGAAYAYYSGGNI